MAGTRQLLPMVQERSSLGNANTDTSGFRVLTTALKETDARFVRGTKYRQALTTSQLQTLNSPHKQTDGTQHHSRQVQVKKSDGDAVLDTHGKQRWQADKKEDVQSAQDVKY